MNILMISSFCRGVAITVMLVALGCSRPTNLIAPKPRPRVKPLIVELHPRSLTDGGDAITRVGEVDYANVAELEQYLATLPAGTVVSGIYPSKLSSYAAFLGRYIRKLRVFCQEHQLKDNFVIIYS